MSIPATIIMPTISTPSKIAATKSYGAHVIFSGSTSIEREAVMEEEVKKTGAALIPPYDHPDIILGAGTLGLEMQAQVAQMLASSSESTTLGAWTQPKCSYATAAGDHGPKPGRKKGLDAIIAPCGGGGMLSGTALSCAGTGIFVFGAEPSFQGANDCARGLSAGRRIERVSTLTIADGLRTPVGAIPWSIISKPEMVRAVYSVSEEQIKGALRLVLERMKMVVEPSAVVGLAVALYNEEFRGLVEREAGDGGGDLGVVLSGGNTSLEALAEIFAVDEKKGQRREGRAGADGRRVAEGVAG
jgi:threonine dehydratase